ncbi:MAG: phosphoribosylformylglycinamidine cyclo-ligase [Pseudomonadota bacterium]
MSKKALRYATAGVSTSRGDRLVERIVPLARRTFRGEVLTSVGGFASLARVPSGYRRPILVTSTDGVGTKVLLARELGIYDTVGIDLVAMSVNDVLTLGAEPFLFLDYFATSRIDLGVGCKIIRGIAEGCRRAGCALVGGETAEMPQVYRKGDFDLAGFCVGVVEKNRIIDGRKVRPGDRIIGVPSSGLHSNGYSLVRAICRRARVSNRRKRELLRPTRIYVREVLRLLRRITPRAMAHVTGSGIEGNLPRVMPRGTAAEINRASWRVPELFRFLQEAGGVSEREMFRTFNMGIGFLLIVRAEDSETVLHGVPGARLIGRVVRRVGEPSVIWKN